MGITSSMATLIALSGASTIEQGGTRFVKDIIRAGTFRHPITGAEIEVTPARMDHWVDVFEEIIEDGFDVEATVDHSASADDVVGYIREMYRDGDRLMAVFDFPTERGQELARTVKNVSVEIMPEWKKGDGKVYKDALSRVSIVQEPVIPGQSEFQALSARLAPADGIHFLSGSKPMLNEMLKKLATICGADLTEGIAEEEGWQRVLEKVQGMAEEMAAMKKPAEGKKPDTEMPKEVAALSAKYAGSRISALVSGGKLTPAAADKLRAQIKNQPVLLSANAEGTLALDPILDALEENTAINTGSDTKAQTLSGAPHGTDAKAETEKQIDRMLSLAGQGK